MKSERTDVSTVVEGPSIGHVPYHLGGDQTVSFRLVEVYDIGSDQRRCRFDILLNAKEVTVGGRINSRIVGTQFNGALETVKSFLITPSSGVKNCINFRGNKADLISILEGLAAAIKQHAQ